MISWVEKLAHNLRWVPNEVRTILVGWPSKPNYYWLGGEASQLIMCWVAKKPTTYRFGGGPSQPIVSRMAKQANHLLQ